jgi:DNA-directed RNA polymerase specialized sigma24 family protein
VGGANLPRVNPSFTDFYEREFDRLVRAIRPIVGPNAEDVVQEAFMVTYARWSEVVVLAVPFAWVRRVALRMAMRLAKRDAARPQLEAALAPHDILSEPVPDEGVISLIQALPHRQAISMWLHHIEDRPVSEVADRLNCSTPAAKVLLHRSRVGLMERIEPMNGRWVSERNWGPDEIVGQLRSDDAGKHVDTILVEDLEGRGGRWEMEIKDRSYSLWRDDGLRLDHGSVRVRGNRMELRPTLATGSVLFSAQVDANWMSLSQLKNSTPPTKGVPDRVWMKLFLGSDNFVYSGKPTRTA